MNSLIQIIVKADQFDKLIKCAESTKSIGPIEELMREHAALSRMLLIYDETLNRLQRKENFPIDGLKTIAKIVKDYTEEFHEEALEDSLVFPRLKKANKYTDLIEKLKSQHHEGQDITKMILKEKATSFNLVGLIQSFMKMYRPHASQEDTMIFPAFRKLLTDEELDEFGDRFAGLHSELPSIKVDGL